MNWRDSYGAETLAEVPSSALATAMDIEGPADTKAALSELIDRLVSIPKDPRARLCQGLLTLEPADGALKPKEIPLGQYFQKALSIRDNLRILEQKVNSSVNLDLGLTVVYHSLITQAQAAVLEFACRWQTELTRKPTGEVSQLLGELILERQRRAMRGGRPSLGERWVGGRVSYHLSDGSLTEPISCFFHRLLVMRDALGSLEAALDAEQCLEPNELKVMTGYLRRSKGSLTTFNILFKRRDDYFSSGR